jgi:hypothetical protein
MGRKSVIRSRNQAAFVASAARTLLQSKCRVLDSFFRCAVVLSVGLVVTLHRSMHPFTMRINEVGTDAELLTVKRPCACPAAGCKCCCYQTALYSSGNTVLGSIKETCYFCVPSFKIMDASGQLIYLLHPPTCCCGVCMNCCTEGNPCGRGCCKVPFWIFDPSVRSTNGGNAKHLGKILKKPKSTAVELFTDASAFEVHFPESSTVEQKAVLVGTAVFLNAVFFESAE